MPRLAVALGLAATLASVPAQASGRRPPAPDGRPFPRGTLLPSVGLGGMFGGSLSYLNFGGGITWFVWHGVGLGLHVDDTVLIWSKATKADFPNIAKETPTNILRVTPALQWVFVRTRWFSPYVLGGVGPVFFNNRGGTYGQWLGGAGALVGLGGRLFLDLGVSFSGLFPLGECRNAFDYTLPTGQIVSTGDPCSFRWAPRLGLVFSFGGGGRRAEAPPPKSAPVRVQRAAPSRSSGPPPVAEPPPVTPAATPAPTPAPTPATTPPADPAPPAPPEEAPKPVPQPATPPSDPATPPTESAPASPRDPLMPDPTYVPEQPSLPPSPPPGA